MKIFTLILGVALSGVVHTAPGQSEITTPNIEPIETIPDAAETRRVDVPEVVLQLKYDKGELNRIYLTQFRKDSTTWVPSVSARSNLCADLCHAGFYLAVQLLCPLPRKKARLFTRPFWFLVGNVTFCVILCFSFCYFCVCLWKGDKGLGGEACGTPICSQLVPVGLQSALKNTSKTDELYGHPRYNVCPALCKNHLGAPLCSCPEKATDHSVDWSAVCAAFCHDGYALSGCPTCETTSTEASSIFQSSRSLSTYEGWAAWCNVQCRQGQGGAACNCDRAPFQ